MAGWQDVLGRFAVDVENKYDELKYNLRERLGGRDPIKIRTYRGFGTHEKLFLKGRVLEDKGINRAMEDDTIWENLLNMYRRFESDEIPYAQVVVRFQDQEQVVVTDEEGFFEVWIEPEHPLPGDRLWHDVRLKLLKPDREEEPPVEAEGHVLVPPRGAMFGVISDIDDTVLQTDATHLINMARTVFLGNARTRLPFPGVAAFYRALLQGPRPESGDLIPAGPEAVGEDGKPRPINPLFYVSSSPWNIYDLLTDFFHLQDIPIGPALFLRDWGLSEEDFIPTGHRSYKLKSIRRIMDTYPNLPFILIGDSGQEDPEIYAEVVDLYPDRVLAIYIRNVSRDLERPEAIRELAKDVTGAGSTLILAKDTLPMAEHAVEQGWISPEALPAVKVEKEVDEGPPNELEKLLGEEEEEAPAVELKAGDAEAAKEAIDEGMIEEALEEGKSGDKPPAVTVKGDAEPDES